jgi:hypothetical protein
MKWSHSTTQQQTIKQSIKCCELKSYTSVSLWNADSHLLSHTTQKKIIAFLIAKFVWGFENVLPSDNKSKVKWPLKMLTNLCCWMKKIVYQLHTHTHTEVLFSPKSNTLWMKTKKHMNYSILDMKSSKLNFINCSIDIYWSSRS